MKKDLQDATFRGELMYPQIETIRKALALIPDEEMTQREGAMRALETLYATMEVQGARIIQLNNMIPLDEVGNPATQEYVDALLRRPPLPQAPPVAGLAPVVCLAVDVLGDPERAAQWLDTPTQVLGGRAPREVATTDAQTVLAILTRMEHGIHE